MHRRIAISALASLAMVFLLGLVSFALPVRNWRTGEVPEPRLAIVTGGPVTRFSSDIWIDTDAACGAGSRIDSDDCLAILYLASSPDVHIIGISTVAGNASLDVTDRTTRQLVEHITAQTSGAIPVYRGSSPSRPGKAAAALQRALQTGPVTIVALGPLTNIVDALHGRSDLQRNVSRLVAVMGRRPGHVFHPAEAHGHGILFGHGPVFSDFNVARNPAAARAVIAMHLPLTLVPYDAARDLLIDKQDLDRLARASTAAAWVARRSRSWLHFWNDVVGLPGYYAFDLVAAAYASHPSRFDCARARVWVARASGLFASFYHPLGVFAGPLSKSPANAVAREDAVYCTGVRPGTHTVLMSQLDGHPHLHIPPAHRWATGAPPYCGARKLLHDGW